MYTNLQSKPGADYLLYINFDGYDSNDNSLDEKDKSWLLEKASYCNVDGSSVYDSQYLDPVYGRLYKETSVRIKKLGPQHPIRRTYNLPLDRLIIPGVNQGYIVNTNRWTSEDFTNIWRFVSYKLEPFNVNVTTDKSIWTNFNKSNRYMTIVSFMPSANTLSVNFGTTKEDILNVYDHGLSYFRLCHEVIIPNTTLKGFWGLTKIKALSHVNFVMTTTAVYPFTVIKTAPERTFTQRYLDGTKMAEDLGLPLVSYLLGSQSADRIAFTIAHEFYHIILNNGKEQQLMNGDFVSEHPVIGSSYDWIPMMGTTRKGTQTDINPKPQNIPYGVFYEQSFSNLYQWCKGEYTNSSALGKNDDIDLLGKKAGWIKTPPNSKNPTKLFL